MPPIQTTKPPSLVIRFALYAGAAVALTAALALVVVRANTTLDAEGDVRDDANYVAEELARDDLAGSAFIRPVGEDEQAELDDFVGLIASARDLTRVALVSPNGTITYSTERDQIGRRLSAGALANARRAVAGGDLFETASEGGRRMLTSYVPVRWLLHGRERPVGALIAYRDYASVADQIRQELLFQAGSVVLALLLLYAAMLPILRRVTATLEARNQSLVAQTELLRTSEARHRALMEQASDGILVCDEKARVLDANASLAAMTGYSIAELKHLTVHDLIDEADLDRLPLRIGELLDGKTVLQERRVRRKDGALFVGEFHGTMLEDGRIHASLRDVSARNRLEQELREAHQGDVQTRAVGAITAEFKALLDSITSHGERLLNGVAVDDPLRASVVEIQDAAAWGSSLVERLQDHSGRRESHPEVVEPSELVGRMDEMMRLLLGKRVRLELELEPTDRIEADPYHLQKVVVDLVLHARDSMPRGGTVTLKTANVEFQERADDGSGLAAGRFVMLAVSSNGPGPGAGRVAEAYSAHEPDDMIGPGLAAVYAIVRRSGGSVGIESGPQRGMTVRVYLPSVDTAEAAEPALRAV
jgi:PAS domain S-box-containing protein